MTLHELIEASNRAVDEAKPGTRPYFVLELPGKHRGNRVPLGHGISGKVVWRSPSRTAMPPSVAVRVFSDEVHAALLRAGLAKPTEDAVTKPAVAATKGEP